ncbi:MAG: hypothetical protein AAF909_09160 [Pseudomonadota bacterium]
MQGAVVIKATLAAAALMVAGVAAGQPASASEIEVEVEVEVEVESEGAFDNFGFDDAPPAEPQPFWMPETVELFGNVEFEGTGFFQDPLLDEQTRDSVSVAIRPSLLLEWAGGDAAFTLTPFARLDSADERRRHWDLREAKFDFRGDRWALTVGADFVFFGRTEALQLVDIINSDDGVEDIDGEDKLGQPMVRFSYLTDGYGALSAYWLPYFREPTFPGTEGRLRPSLRIADEDVRYGSGAEEWTQAAALRWEQVIGDFDFGVTGFYGLSRDAAFEPIVFEPIATPPFARPTVLRPVYDEIAQIGFDGQFTSGPALWKLEAIGRTNQLDRTLTNRDYVAVTGGVEYTFYSVFGGTGDLGVLLEGAWDSRGEDALTNLEEDVVYGLRYGFNDDRDTAILLFGATDVVSGGTSVRLEAERRIFDSWKLTMEGQGFLVTHPEDIEDDFRRDSYLRLKLAYFW